MFKQIIQIISFALICALLILTISTSAFAGKEPTAFRIEVADQALARKIVISFHHALLTVDYEKGVIIADLNTNEVTDLTELGLKVNKDVQWQEKYQKHQHKIQTIQQARSNKKAAGIPGYSCYATVEETLQFGSDLATTYPTLAEWLDIGDSWKKTNGEGGYDLMVLKITNKSITGNKPKLFLNSGMHAREYTPVAVTTDFAKLLLEQYSTDADIKWIVDHHEVHILFHTNPDGRKIAESGKYQRKNVHSNSCSSDQQGVDLNRNFKHFWHATANGSSGDACSEVYRGGSAESEPETQAMSNYMRAIFPDARGPQLSDAAASDTTGMHIDIHSSGKLVLWPYGHTNTPTGNDASYKALGKKIAWLNNYAPQQSIGLYPTDGTSDDVSYGELGVAALTFELGTDFFQSCSSYNSTVKVKNLPALLYAAKSVAAPYQLPFGPEITAISINSTTEPTTIGSGSAFELAVTADMSRTKQSSSGKSISKIEYSINTPIWQANAEIKTLADHDGDLSSTSETFKKQVATDGLTNGQHTLYLRAYSDGNKQGVVSAQFINIGTNNAPVANFTYQCTNLVCSFNGESSSDSDGTIATYQWNFGGGNTATEKTPSYTYTSAGEKTVILTVTDNSNNTHEKSASFTLVAATTEPEMPNEPDKSEKGGGSLFWLSGLMCLLVARRKASQ